jgi:hypothetical protein
MLEKETSDATDVTKLVDLDPDLDRQCIDWNLTHHG